MAPEAPGLAEQFRRTRGSFQRLARAHWTLLRAELGAILGFLGSMAAKAGIVLALGLLMMIMLYVGGLLFIGEWLFGSIGWGLAHGVLLPFALIVAFGLGIVGGTRSPALIGLLVGVLVAVAVAVLLGFNIAWQTASYFAQNLVAPLDTPGAVGAIAGALILGLLMLFVLAIVGGVAGAIAGLVIGAVLGALLGFAMTVDEWTWGPAVGLGITLGLIVWPVVNIALTWPRLDLEAHFARLKPQQTMEAVAETREWLEEQWQTKSPLRGRK
ncbi:MAG TPA: hypothetical protein VM305_09385 [Candidatus Limnocylindrales bacterium]|nr:hypothetical protein [Candidatus Limnocylindrales bacterium]